MVRRTPQQIIDPLLLPTHVCRTLGISLATFRRWDDRGLLPTVKIGRSVRMRAEDLAKVTRTGVLLK
jgi:excisionase family DNA binding protein